MASEADFLLPKSAVSALVCVVHTFCRTPFRASFEYQSLGGLFAFFSVPGKAHVVAIARIFASVQAAVEPIWQGEIISIIFFSQSRTGFLISGYFSIQHFDWPSGTKSLCFWFWFWWFTPISNAVFGGFTLRPRWATAVGGTKLLVRNRFLLHAGVGRGGRGGGLATIFWRKKEEEVEEEERQRGRNTPR